MATGSNSGIVVSGHGKLDAQNVTVGRNAISYVFLSSDVDRALREHGHEDLREKLKALQDAVNQNVAIAQQPREMHKAAQVLSQQLAQPKPDKRTVTGVLGALAEGFKSATTVVTAVELLKHAVMALV